MGIFESVQRSQPHINSLSDLVQNYYAHQREAERRQRILEMLKTQEPTAGEGKTVGIRNPAGGMENMQLSTVLTEFRKGPVSTPAGAFSDVMVVTIPEG